MRVDEKTNEIPVAQAVLPTLPIKHRVCTADALHTQTDFMRVIHAQQAETVLTVKGNQPTLSADLATYFADPQAHYVGAQTVDRRRGRLEVRTIKVSTEMTAYLAPCWPYVAQVAQLTRSVTKASKTTTMVVYLITTLSPTKASPQRLLALNRGHWSIGAIRFAETSEKLGDGEQGGERSLTTERVTWGAIPHPLGERGNAAPSR